jgi:predicted regulator of Ras-like GTPase activity (Roadblock/LC7/MglB family)
MIHQFSRTAMLFIEKTLLECEQCEGFSGAALSSPDGLILAMQGQISGDEAAACASSLFVDSTTALNYISESQPKMMLIWTQEKLLSLHKLTDGSIFFIASTEMSNYHAILKFGYKLLKS